MHAYIHVLLYPLSAQLGGRYLPKDLDIVGLLDYLLASCIFLFFFWILPRCLILFIFDQQAQQLATLLHNCTYFISSHSIRPSVATGRRGARKRF